MPHRVQLRRTKGWRMPDNTVSVARPGRWSNPFRTSDWLDRETSLVLFRNLVRGIWNPSVVDHLSVARRDKLYHACESWLDRLDDLPEQAAQRELRGKNLACWCSLSEKCHGDILLEVASRDLPPESA